MKKLVLDGRASLPSQIPIPGGKAAWGRVELCQVPIFPEYTFSCASPLMQQNDRVAGALQQAHKCCSGLWGANNAGDGRVQAEDRFQPWEQSTLSADSSLLLPGDSACPWCWQGTNWQHSLGYFVLGLHQRLERGSSFATQLWGRCQWVALVCSNGPCKGMLLFAVALCLAARTLGLPKTASCWITEVWTACHREVWYK